MFMAFTQTHQVYTESRAYNARGKSFLSCAVHFPYHKLKQCMLSIVEGGESSLFDFQEEEPLLGLLPQVRQV